jgi:hypothetical protein
MLPRNRPRCIEPVKPMVAAQVTGSAEALSAELARVVNERHSLEAKNADAKLLEENRQRLAAVQSGLSRLLLAGHRVGIA